MESHQKRFLKLKCFSPLRILTSPLFEETLGAFLFLPLFSFSLFPFFKKEEPESAKNESEKKESVTYNVDELVIRPDISLLFGGDTHFVWAIQDLQEKKDLAFPVRGIIPLLKKSQFSALNLETVFALTGNPEEQKAHIFASDPANAQLLQSMGIDGVMLANNHAMDLGDSGLAATRAALINNGILYAGAGDNANEALKPIYLQIEGTTFAIISLDEIGSRQIYADAAHPGVADLRWAVQAIAAARQYAKHVIVNVHWGKEYMNFADRSQVIVAHRMIDAGATVVIGHHPHIPQGIEAYRNGLIFYSLGNFLFGSENFQQKDNFLAELLFSRENGEFTGAKLYPINGVYRKSGHSIFLLKKDDTKDFYRRMYALSRELESPRSRRVDFSLQEDGSADVVISQGAK